VFGAADADPDLRAGVVLPDHLKALAGHPRGT